MRSLLVYGVECTECDLVCCSVWAVNWLLKGHWLLDRVLLPSRNINKIWEAGIKSDILVISEKDKVVKHRLYIRGRNEWLGLGYTQGNSGKCHQDLTLYTRGNWPIWIGLNWNVSYRKSMKIICITIVAIEMEDFVDHGKISRPKVECTTIHLTQDWIQPLHCWFYIYSTLSQLLITKSEYTLDTFSNIIIFLEIVG
jgi:hypothetical protein